MSLTCPDAPPTCGAVYRTGDYVQKGNVLGLSKDRSSVVVALASGWARLVESDSFLNVEIWLTPQYEGEAECRLEIAR